MRRTWGDGGFDDGDLQVRAGLAEHVRRAQSARAGADDDDVAFGVGVKVLKVASGHSPRHLTLPDGIEGERFPTVGHVVEGLGLAVDDNIVERFLCL